MNIHERIKEWESTIGKNLFQNIGISPNATIIDFGCGYGEYSLAASKYISEGKIYAIDKNKIALSSLKKRINEDSIENVEVIQNNGELSFPFSDGFADAILFYDVIHGNESKKNNEIQTITPIRFNLYKEAYRVLKENGILSIAPFHECDRMRDKQGKQRRYSKEQLTEEIHIHGFGFMSDVDGAIHFENYHSQYQWKKHNDDLQSDNLEQGITMNFIKRMV